MNSASHLLMVRPAGFGFNPETAVNNAFQVAEPGNVQERALSEFDRMVQLLNHHHIEVTIVNDMPSPETPDSIFPNNWVSFHEGGIMCLYPMFAPIRRLEKKPELIEFLQRKFNVSAILDLSPHENENRFLEGTGSMVLDRRHKIAYACLSPRTHIEVLEEFCCLMKYKPIPFHGEDKNRIPVYHTNVMMTVGNEYAVICLDSIADTQEKDQVVTSLRNSEKEIIPITHHQMQHFAGNMLEVFNKDGKSFVIMSTQAYQSLNTGQITTLQKYSAILHTPLYTIEANGGGSARCMITEVF
ncbi:MAG: amidinotransferase [Chitinophagaceae bacterium]|nr:amidinotransferase [Chitinophagaceae bacterium]